MTDAALDQQVERSLSWLEEHWNTAAPAEEHAAAARSLTEVVDLLRTAYRQLLEGNESLRAGRDAAERERRGCCALLEAMPDGYLVTGSDGVIREANAAAADLLGGNRDDLVGRSLGDIIAGECLPGFANLLASLAEGAATGRDTFTLHPLSGSPFTVSATVVRLDPTDSRDDEELRWALRDVTEMQALEEQLRDAQRLEAIGRLTGGIAHEFNNLLMIINGEAQFMLEAVEPDAALRTDIEEIRQAGLRATELTSQLLAFTRRQNGERQALNLNDVVESMARILRRIIGEDVSLRLDLAADLGVVRADASQIRQMIINLAINARDAMPSGGTLTLSTANEGPASAQAEAERPYVRLAIGDTGRGMSPEVQARLFEPFFTTKGIGEGTGLGLTMVQGLVRELGGQIEVSSREGEGTTIALYLPRERATSHPDAAAERAADLPGGSEVVLVVEDDAHVRQMTVRMLNRLGYRVLEADSSEGAKSILAAESGIDLVLTDIVMPGASGWDLAEDLRRTRPGLKILFMSGYPREKLGHGVIGDGVHLLAKPFTIRQLATQVREVLNEPWALEAGGTNRTC
jgi:two-component system cell cycle sensor histidine kinase/response regulator CckA